MWIPAIPRPDTLVDPTGAGDAYRGGLIKGLVTGQSLEQSCRLGAACASFAIEVQGTQEYSFAPEEFDQRFAGAIRPALTSTKKPLKRPGLFKGFLSFPGGYL